MLYGTFDQELNIKKSINIHFYNLNIIAQTSVLQNNPFPLFLVYYCLPNMLIVIVIWLSL